MKTWHLTLTRATHARTLTLNGTNGEKVTLERGKVTVTNVDLGSALGSPMVRVIRLEESAPVAVETVEATIEVTSAPEPEPEPAPEAEVEPEPAPEAEAEVEPEPAPEAEAEAEAEPAPKKRGRKRKTATKD